MDLESYGSGVMQAYDVRITDCIIKSIDDFPTIAVIVRLKAKYGDQTVDCNIDI